MAVEVKNASLVSSADAAGILAFREVLKQQSHLVRSVVLHAGQARQLDAKLLALPWGWMVATEEAR